MTDNSNPPASQEQTDAFAWLNSISATASDTYAPGASLIATYIRGHGRLRSEEQWEVVRSLLYPMVVQRIPLAEISRIFDISVDTAGRWRKRLFDDMRRDAVTMQPRDFIMEGVESLREARAEAWKGYMGATTSKDKRAFLHAVTQIENQFGKLGADIGLYGGRGEKPMSPASYGDTTGDPAAQSAQRIQQMLARLHSGPEEVADGGTMSALGDDSGEEGYDVLLADIRVVCPPPAATVANQRGPEITVRRRSPPPKSGT